MNGSNYNEVAAILSIARCTVETHASNIRLKTEVNSLLGLVTKIWREVYANRDMLTV